LANPTGTLAATLLLFCLTALSARVISVLERSRTQNSLAARYSPFAVSFLTTLRPLYRKTVFTQNLPAKPPQQKNQEGLIQNQITIMAVNLAKGVVNESD